MLDIRINKLNFEEDNVGKNFNIHLRLKKGDALFVGGPTGCGKTTILKIISGIIPNVQPAKFSGEICLDKKRINLDEAKKDISFSFQDPENQFLMNTIDMEVFFRLNNIERKRAYWLLNEFGLRKKLKKSLKDLSTGQRKIVSLITALSKSSEIKILDEPISNLDKINLSKLKGVIRKLRKESIFVFASHDYQILDCCSHFLIFDEKNKKWKVSQKIRDIAKNYEGKLFKDIVFKDNRKLKEKDIIVCDKLFTRYPDGVSPLKNLCLRLDSGDIVGIFGKNGSGKTTLVKVLTKKIRPSSGEFKIKKNKRIALVMQEPEKQLFSDTVLNELLLTLNKKKFRKKAISVLKEFNLYEKRNEHPFFLSRGQKQLLLILSVLLTEPEILILDEPFTGIDYKNCQKIMKAISEFHEKYSPVIIITSQKEDKLKKLIKKKIFLN